MGGRFGKLMGALIHPARTVPSVRTPQNDEPPPLDHRAGCPSVEQVRSLVVPRSGIDQNEPWIAAGRGKGTSP